MEQPTIPNPPPPVGGRPVQVTGVQFRTAGKIYEFDAGSLALGPGDQVVVDTDRGPALGFVARPPAPAPPSAQRFQKVARKADARDLARHETNLQKERDAHRLCLIRIRERRMSMKLVKVEYALRRQQSDLLLLRRGPGRLPRPGARPRAVAAHAHRDEADRRPRRDQADRRRRPVRPRALLLDAGCASSSAVSVKMAKEQGLSLNPSKLAGMCGRLKCCLRYEYETYLELRPRRCPSVGTRGRRRVKGDGVVVRQNVLKQTVDRPPRRRRRGGRGHARGPRREAIAATPNAP